MTSGPLMLDIEGLQLDSQDRSLLSNPLVGGLILFSRNYANPLQLEELIQSIRQLRPDIIIAVDQEGGRVQRFRQGFTRLPPMAVFGGLFQEDAASALQQCRETGWLMAQELIQFDIDISFAPVLDIDRGISGVIGDRAFADDPDELIELSRAFIDGMAEAGMAATGKHFPGHGGVEADSHVAIPVDERSLEQLFAEDMRPFATLSGQLAGIMPAHVIYPEVDPQPAGFSSFWLQEILRGKLAFDGVIFSDDLSMEGASVAGDFEHRAEQAMQAGCDMVLVCNNRPAALQVLAFLEETASTDCRRLARMRHQGHRLDNLQQNTRWQHAAKRIDQLVKQAG